MIMTNFIRMWINVVSNFITPILIRCLCIHTLCRRIYKSSLQVKGFYRQTNNGQYTACSIKSWTPSFRVHKWFTASEVSHDSCIPSDNRSQSGRIHIRFGSFILWFWILENSHSSGNSHSSAGKRNRSKADFEKCENFISNRQGFENWMCVLFIKS